MGVLAKGLEFMVAPCVIPTESIIEGVEVALRDLAEMDAEAIRGMVSGILQTTQPLPINLLRDEREALRALKEDKRLAILKAGNGNTVVVMDKSSYDSKSLSILQSATFKKMPKDPTSKMDRGSLLSSLELWTGQMQSRMG